MSDVLDFPASPAIGDVFVGSTGSEWEWDGVKWSAIGQPGPQGPLGPEGPDGPPGSSSFAPLAGDFVVPAIGDTVTIELVQALWCTPGAIIFVGGMYGVVQSVAGNDVTVQRIAGGPFSGPIVGVTDGSDAAPGMVGEYLVFISATGEDTPPTDLGYAVIPNTEISLPPGDWDVSCNVDWAGGAGIADADTLWIVLSDLPATASDDDVNGEDTNRFGGLAGWTPDEIMVGIGPVRFSFANWTTVRMFYALNGAGGYPTANSMITARRVR